MIGSTLRTGAPPDVSVPGTIRKDPPDAPKHTPVLPFSCRGTASLAAFLAAGTLLAPGPARAGFLTAAPASTQIRSSVLEHTVLPAERSVSLNLALPVLPDRKPITEGNVLARIENIQMTHPEGSAPELIQPDPESEDLQAEVIFLWALSDSIFGPEPTVACTDHTEQIRPGDLLCEEYPDGRIHWQMVTEVIRASEDSGEGENMIRMGDAVSFQAAELTADRTMHWSGETGEPIPVASLPKETWVFSRYPDLEHLRAEAEALADGERDLRQHATDRYVGFSDDSLRTSPDETGTVRYI